VRLSRRIEELEEKLAGVTDAMRLMLHRRMLLALHKVYGEEGSPPPDVGGLTIEDVERRERECEDMLDREYSSEEVEGDSAR
jgi:hypothetical protein